MNYLWLGILFIGLSCGVLGAIAGTAITRALANSKIRDICERHKKASPAATDEASS